MAIGIRERRSVFSVVGNHGITASNSATPTTGAEFRGCVKSLNIYFAPESYLDGLNYK